LSSAALATAAVARTVRAARTMAMRLRVFSFTSVPFFRNRLGEAGVSRGSAFHRIPMRFRVLSLTASYTSSMPIIFMHSLVSQAFRKQGLQFMPLRITE